MGVKGLWRLLLPIGRRISIETLEGQILAIDASIWLTQFLTVAARQREQELLGDGDTHYGSNSNNSGKAYSYDYLVGFLRRLCKLRYQGVRPVLVFDGETPEIKKREIRDRNRRRKRKLGETFYLGDRNGNGKIDTQEEEELMEATRRVAKRILAKQLRNGQLVTTKNKRNNKHEQTRTETNTNHKNNNSGTSNNRKNNTGNASIAIASYAPGFYDPDATTAAVAPERQTHQDTTAATRESVLKDGDDDHLLRDDYNTNPLREEINDWDRPIVVDSDDETNTKPRNKSNITNTSGAQSPTGHKRRKSTPKMLFEDASRFHAGDGTKFKVESVADLPESARKDVIEDARKQRRLASRREFMGVASDPDGLSSCQLRNFLKSTKLNRDIVSMARQAKTKAEEEAKMTMGNGILFEKDNDNDGMFKSSGSSSSSNRNFYPGRKGTSAAASRRQHYRSGGTYNGAHIGKKKANAGMMRMFHHMNQPRKGNASIANHDTNDEDIDDDEHDFRKARNNHYLSGGIRFVNSGDKEEEKTDDCMEDYLNDEKEERPQYHNNYTSATATPNDDGGGFVIAVMDGSDRPRKKITGHAAMGNVGGGEIIEIEISSSSESDGDDSEDDRKPSAASQELQDEALARALQTIEEEEVMIGMGKDDTGECIEIDDSDDDGSDPGGGFLKNSSSFSSSPSKERNSTRDSLTQQAREDASLARTLQEAEYGGEEIAADGGGLLVGSKEDTVDKEENADDGGGFLVSEIECKTDKSENMDIGEGSLLPTNEDMAEKEENSVDDRGFLLPTKKHTICSINSESPPSSSHRDHEREGDNEMIIEEASLPRVGSNPFESNQSGSNASKSIFALSKQSKIQKIENHLLICDESSQEEEEEDDIYWEDGNSNSENIIQREEDSKRKSNATGVIIQKKEYELELSQNDVKHTIHIDNSDHRIRGDNREEANLKDGGCKSQKLNNVSTGSMHDDEASDLPKKNKTATINTKGADRYNGEEVDGDEEVDWGYSTEEANESKPKVIHASAGIKEMKSTDMNILCESRVTSDNDNDDVDWEEGNSETNVCTQGIIDVSLERKVPTQLAETILNSTDTEKKETDDMDDEDDGEVDWEDGEDEIDEGKPEVIDLCEEKQSEDLLEKFASNKADDEDDEVDWEDGDDETEKTKTDVIDLCEESKGAKSSIKPALDSIELDTKEANNNVEWNGSWERAGKLKVRTSSTEEKHWERDKLKVKFNDQEVEEATNRKYNTEETSKHFDTVKQSLSKPKVIDLDHYTDDNDNIEWKDGELGEKDTLVDVDDWGETKTRSSDEVAAALEHAQGTAANLTNWAGRAFRRAVAQHAIENGMEVPESAKPGVLKSTRNDMDRDEPVPNHSKTVARSAQRTSQGSIQSSSKRDSIDRRKIGEKIDNSSWLDTVDTANSYAEDYTVAPQEANFSDRLMDTSTGGVTEEMRTEVMQLLRLFGIPYVVAPAEAEAQCVELERLGLVDGIVTEDSDTFVFGGQVIYKNIFEDKKYVEVYHSKDASEEMNLTQDSLVALAMLLGGDYTEGVNGVGIVNGMEVLQAFDVAEDCEAGLKRFRKWLDGFDPNDLTKKPNNIKSSKDDGDIRSEKEQLFHRKHHTARTRWIAPKHFPDVKVLNAYLNPVVDTSTERFSWGIPDLDGLIAFCHGHMGWVADETKKLVDPIIQQMEEGSMRQTRIDSFMRYEDGIKFAKIQSKRLRQVLGLSSKDSTTSEKSRRKRVQTTAPASRNKDEENGNDEFDDPGDSYSDPEEIFAIIDATSNANVAIHEPYKKADQPQPKKRYHGKRTRSLAALSSASASTIAIASSSKSDGIIPGSTSADGPLGSVARRRTNHKNLPKKAPPSYQKQSSAIIDEQKDNLNTSELLGDTKTNTYEVINPSMI